LEPELSIVGSTINLFKDEKFGIQVFNLNKTGLEIYKNIYNRRDNIFDKRSYTFGQSILCGVNCDGLKIPIAVKFSILTAFHCLFLKALIEHTKNDIVNKR
jgi:hypothetical protein